MPCEAVQTCISAATAAAAATEFQNKISKTSREVLPSSPQKFGTTLWPALMLPRPSWREGEHDGCTAHPASWGSPGTETGTERLLIKTPSKRTARTWGSQCSRKHQAILKTWSDSSLLEVNYANYALYRKMTTRQHYLIHIYPSLSSFIHIYLYLLDTWQPAGPACRCHHQCGRHSPGKLWPLLHMMDNIG